MTVSRRQFIQGAGFLSLLTFPKLLRAVPLYEKKLTLHHMNTGEWLKETIATHEPFPKEFLQKIDYFMRDWRTGTQHAVDQRLVTLLLKMLKALPSKSTFDVVCGYRSLKTNQALRQKSLKVAKNSLHCKGKAIDLSCPGIKLKDLRDVAKKLKMGGVGYYPRSNFIHVDIRDQPYYW